MKNQNGFALIGILIVIVIIAALVWGVRSLSKSPASPVNQIEEGRSVIDAAQQAKDAIEGADQERLQMLQE